MGSFGRALDRLGAGGVLAVGAVLAAALVVVYLVAHENDGLDPARGSLSSTDPGVVHVHGLGVDPGDGMLYAATHAGLFRLPEGGDAVRVADRFQDTMGFTVVGPGRFLGSGHPDVREMTRDGLPPLLGLIESDDAGGTWRNLSLSGQSDFHVLVAAHGLVYGYDATNGRLMVTEDRVRWENRSTVVLGSFAVDPADPEHLLGTLEGVVTASSSDGGRAWNAVRGAPSLTVLAWDEEGGLWGASADGTAWRGTQGGAAWERRGALGGTPEAFLATDEALYAAAEGVGVLQSHDGGITWTVRYEERPGE